MYLVKEIFHTLQGEGANAGTPAVFLRFAGCNLWSGRERHRAAAICRFCDTDFVGTDGPGGKFRTATALAKAVTAKWPGRIRARRFVVCTGGEPLLQLDRPLVAALHARGEVSDLSRVTVRRDSLGQSCAYHGPRRELPALTPQSNKQRT